MSAAPSPSYSGTAAFAADAPPVGPKAETPVIAKSPETTSQRLLDADKEQQNWITHHKDYSAQRFSTLDQINAGNVKGLKVAWTMQLGGVEGGGIWTHGGLEGTPIVEDGFMYVTDGWGSVYKIDTHGGKGTLLWKMDPKTDHDWAGAVACCGVDNRGVGLYNDLVISHTLDGRLIATDKETGQVKWQRQVADPDKGEVVTGAPLHREEHGDNRAWPAPNMEFADGLPRRISTLRRRCGARTRCLTKGEPGSETWGGTNSAETTGGGSTWVTGSYDPSTNTIIWGVGNPGPDWDNAYRPGDNLYTDSSLAVDADTGKIKWHFQHTPNDPYDYDSVAENVLVDVDGKKLALEADRNGFGYAVDRTDGKFLWATPFVKEGDLDEGHRSGNRQARGIRRQEASAGLQSGSDAGPRASKYTDICPGNMGGKNWPPTAYNPHAQDLVRAGDRELQPHHDQAGGEGQQAARLLHRRRPFAALPDHRQRHGD